MCLGPGPLCMQFCMRRWWRFKPRGCRRAGRWRRRCSRRSYAAPGVRTHALELAADGGAVLIAERVAVRARHAIGGALAARCVETRASHLSERHDAACNGAAGLGHAAHARSKALGECEGGVVIESEFRRHRADHGLRAVEPLGMIVGCRRLERFAVERDFIFVDCHSSSFSIALNGIPFYLSERRGGPEWPNPYERRRAHGRAYRNHVRAGRLPPR